MLSGKCILIVEEVFLIALDIQRVVEEANAAQTVLARNFAEAEALADRFGEFDLAIINPPVGGSADADIAARLAGGCRAIVVCTAARLSLEGTALSDARMLTKPFADKDLLLACEEALGN
ncbi:MAG: hypothetical protein ABIQ30_10620 [Devosia sp.]